MKLSSPYWSRPKESCRCRKLVSWSYFFNFFPPVFSGAFEVPMMAVSVMKAVFLLSVDLSHAQPSYAGLKGGGGIGSGGGSGSDEAIRSILEQARREMEAQQAALEPILKASSSSSSSVSLSQRDILSSSLTAPLPPYNPLALSLKKPPSSLLSSPSSPSPILDFSSSVKREGRSSSGVDMSADGALRMGRGSEGLSRSGSAGGAGYWREQWWSNMQTDPRRTMSSQIGEENHNQEDSKEVRFRGSSRVSWLCFDCPLVARLKSSPSAGFRVY